MHFNTSRKYEEQVKKRSCKNH